MLRLSLLVWVVSLVALTTINVERVHGLTQYHPLYLRHAFHLSSSNPQAGEPESENDSSRSIDKGVAENKVINKNMGKQKNDGKFHKVKRSPSMVTNVKQQSSPKPQLQQRKMQLMWCGPEECREVIRERVVGEHNHMEFVGPATGQVCYTWVDQLSFSSNNDGDNDANGEQQRDIEQEPEVACSAVLLLVRPNDDDLLKIAADSVRELTGHGIQMLLAPDVAAKMKHFFGVDDEKMIKLFEPRAVSGFGENLQVTDSSKLEEFESHNFYDGPDPDLICTLGGDGLLMHAGMMFPGPVPPILCIAGGSLGFLTPFSKEEMGDTIRISLGFLQGGEEDDASTGADRSDDGTEMKPMTTPVLSNYGYDAFHHLQESSGTSSSPRFSFGLGNRIALSMRMRLDCRVINREGVVRARYNVLNEVVIDRGSSPYLAALECFCDDVHLTTVQADGIIFATPTGSTAYSMAAGGSVVHPAVPAILVTPICPHVLSFRSMVFPDHVVLRCFVPDDARSDASVAFDGKYRRLLQRGDSVQIQMSAHPVPTINRVDHSSDWLNSLKNNFNFNTRARQKPL